LGKQAEIARRAATVQADLRDAKLRLLADDLVTLRTCLDAEVADEAALRVRQVEIEAALDDGRARLSSLEESLAEAAPAAAAAAAGGGGIWSGLPAIPERRRGRGGWGEERARLRAHAPAAPRRGRAPEERERDAAAAGRTASDLAVAVEQAAGGLPAAAAAR